MSDVIANFALGFATALHPVNLFYCFGGVFLGTLIGVLPGIGSLAAVSMLLPLSFYLPPETAIMMLAGVYYGCEYGGSTTAILLNLPGTPSSAVTCIDGYPMAKQGRATEALFVTTIASFVGSMTGIVLLIAVAPLLAKAALAFGPAEYSMMIILGLVATAASLNNAPLKGLTMVLLGVLLGTVGTDINSVITRFSLGHPELYQGIGLIPLAMGIFGVSEVIASIRHGAQGQVERVRVRDMFRNIRNLARLILPMLRGSALGCFFGVLPGTGQTMASFISYSVEKQVAQDPTRFGKGAAEGIAGPEAANNAAVQSAFIPTLVLGIPGTATMALMMGALMIHGIAPGPNLMASEPKVFWGLIASFWIGNLMLVVLNIPLIGIWVSVLRIPYKYLFPPIICLICIGVYSVNNSAFDIYLVIIFGVFGYGMRLFGYEPAPLLIGFILGPMLEQNVRRALLMSRGDPITFISSPISVAFTFLVILLLALSVRRALRRWRKGS